MAVVVELVVMVVWFAVVKAKFLFYVPIPLLGRLLLKLTVETPGYSKNLLFLTGNTAFFKCHHAQYKC